MGEMLFGGVKLMHVHKDATKSINVIEAANSFFRKEITLSLLFGTFSRHELLQNINTRNTGGTIV